MAEAARAIGHIGEYDPQSENITSYLERLSLYMDANAVADERKVPVLLTVIGAKVYGILKSLTSPDLPKAKSLDDLQKALKSHYDPKPLVIAERFRFYQRNQTDSESVAEYAAELRRLTIRCEFKDFLPEALRDKFVCGVRNNAIQKRLLTEAKLTMDSALEIATGMETADRDMKNMKNPSLVPPTVLNLPVKHDHTKRSCYRCGRNNHSEKECRFKEAKCHKCGKLGHIASVCRAKKTKPQGQQHRRNPGHTKWVEIKEEGETPTGEEETPAGPEDMAMFAVESASSAPITVDVSIDDHLLSMEVDTGAAVSVVSAKTLATHFPGKQLSPSTLTLKTYTGETMKVIGEVEVSVKYEEQQPKKLSLVIVEGNGPSLLGRNWLHHIRLNWSHIKVVRLPNDSIATVLNEFKDVFNEGLGTVRSVKAKLTVDESAHPKFCKPRPVPLAMKSAVERELERLERDGVLEKVDFSEWAAPIVAVPKKDGRVRICGDYKVTVNPVLDVEQYPLPRSEDLFATLAGGTQFSKLDLTHAYQQLILEEDSRKFVTINTHRGLYRYTRLPFGIASAPAIFQRTMDMILQGMSGVICYIDDILITGKTQAEHMKNLAAVLQRLREHGLRVKKEKCEFLQPSVEYLGHKIDAKGLHALESKVEAITKAPTPRNVQELRSFLGLLNYYGRFIPNLASILHPLNALLRRDSEWEWSNDCAQAFDLAKEKLVSADLLVHYDATLPLKLAGDASAYGVGAVISHIMPDGAERPIAFASKTLSNSERNYSQVEKEGLALVFGVKKFHTYLYGRRFTLVTDHKPLTTIFGPKKQIPPMAAARLQRWAILLSAYSYEIEFRPTNDHSNADALSRLPLNVVYVDSLAAESASYNKEQLDSLPVTVSKLQSHTRTDAVLSKVCEHTVKGWPDSPEPHLKPYYNRKDELTVESGCLMWLRRVVIPDKLRPRLLRELHRDHPGIWKMKAVARSYFWWPGLDKEVERVAGSCTECQSVKKAPPSAPLHPWVWPTRPWERVHLDFAGPFQNAMFLVAVDAHSKWPEVFIMSSTTSTATIGVLRQMFAAYGLPAQVVTDNGTQFTSDEFATFMKMNGIKHIKSAPYHPATNGLAERFVQSLKQALKTSLSGGLTLSHRLANFLLTYRSSPHATTGATPCSLFLKRQVRTRFDLLKPDQESHVTDQQSQQKAAHDRHAKGRTFHVGQSIMARNLRPGPKWIPGIIVHSLGPLSFLIETRDGQQWRRHVDHLKGVCCDQDSENDSTRDDDNWELPSAEQSSAPTPEGTESTESVPESDGAAEQPSGSDSPEEDNSSDDSESRRYPARSRHPPNYYGQ